MPYRNEFGDPVSHFVPPSYVTTSQQPATKRMGGLPHFDYPKVNNSINIKLPSRQRSREHFVHKANALNLFSDHFNKGPSKDKAALPLTHLNGRIKDELERPAYYPRQTDKLPIDQMMPNTEVPAGRPYVSRNLEISVHPKLLIQNLWKQNSIAIR